MRAYARAAEAADLCKTQRQRRGGTLTDWISIFQFAAPLKTLLWHVLFIKQATAELSGSRTSFLCTGRRHTQVHILTTLYKYDGKMGTSHSDEAPPRLGNTVAGTAACAFDMGRLSPELLGHMFASLDTRTATMVVPRVCRLWKEVCAGVAVLEEFELAWACTKLLNLAGADAWQGASPGRSG